MASSPVAARPQDRWQRLHGPGSVAPRRIAAFAARHEFSRWAARHAAASAAFATPTINGYRRYRPYAMAPDRVIWGRDNRAAMVRVLGGPNDPASRIENRIGEPAANPYLYMGSQILAGLDGMARALDPGPPADVPYETTATPTPRSLAEALEALRGNGCFRAGFGDVFVDYFIRLKEAEIARFNLDVSEWEQREYFDLF